MREGGMKGSGEIDNSNQSPRKSNDDWTSKDSVYNQRLMTQELTMKVSKVPLFS